MGACVEPSRVTRSKAEARSSYNKMSRWYDLAASMWEDEARKAGLMMLDARENERILEIGIGTGNAVEALARSVGQGGRVHGVDISEGMLDEAQGLASRACLAGGLHLACGDGARLPYRSRAFDAIFASFTLELFDTPEIPLVLAEWRRVLRSGGRISVVSLSVRGGNEFMKRAYELVHRLFPALADCRPIDVQSSMSSAHFTVLDAERLPMWGLEVEIVLGRRNE